MAPEFRGTGIPEFPMFWLILILGIITGLLSRSLVRRFLQKLVPKISDGQFDLLLVILLFLISLLSVVKYRGEEAKKKVMLTEMAHLRTRADGLESKTQTTSQLPDGRSLFGNVITGKPTALLREHDEAVASFSAGNFTNCLTHSSNAVKAHEETLQILAGIANYGQNGGAYLPPEETAELYHRASMCAERLGQNEVARRYNEQFEKYLHQSENAVR